MPEWESTVSVTADTLEQARTVLAERLNHDEDYGFTYEVGFDEPTPAVAADDVDFRPTSSCGCGHEVVWVEGHWWHNVAPAIWGDDHEVDEPEPTGPAREHWDRVDCVTD